MTMTRGMNMGPADLRSGDLETVLDTWTPAASLPGLQPAKAKVDCGFGGCTSPWSRLWRRNGRPGFNGLWGCSRACLQNLVESAVRQELGGGRGEDVVAHRHRVPLGLVLLAQGWIKQPQLQHALAAQRAAGRGRIGDWLMEEGVPSTQIVRGLGVQWNCPVLSSHGFDAARMALVMPAQVREPMGAVPLRIAAGRILYVGFSGSVDAAWALAVERMTGLNVECGLVSDGEAVACHDALRAARAVECETEMVADANALTGRIVSALSASQPVASRLVRVGPDIWLRMWLERAALGIEGVVPVTAEDVVDRIYRLAPLQRGLA